MKNGNKLDGRVRLGEDGNIQRRKQWRKKENEIWRGNRRNMSNIGRGQGLTGEN